MDVVWTAAKLTMSIRDTSWSVSVSTPSAASINHWIKWAYCKSQADLDYTGFSAWFPSVSFIFFRCSSMTGARYLWQTRCDCRSPQNSWATSLTFSFVVTPALRSEEMREEAEDLTDLRHLSCVLNSGLNKLRIATIGYKESGSICIHYNKLGRTRALRARNFDVHLFTQYLATWSINILTFMTTLCSIFFLTFNILSWSDKYVKSLQLVVSISFVFVFLRKAQ